MMLATTHKVNVIMWLFGQCNRRSPSPVKLYNIVAKSPKKINIQPDVYK